MKPPAKRGAPLLPKGKAPSVVIMIGAHPPGGPGAPPPGNGNGGPPVPPPKAKAPPKPPISQKQSIRNSLNQAFKQQAAKGK